VRLATDPEFATATGGYLSVRSAKPLVCPEPGHDENIQPELWERTAELLDTFRDSRTSRGPW
jgi:hypothetical protein